MRLRIAAVLVTAVLIGSLTGSATTARPGESGSESVRCGSGRVSYSPAKLSPPNHKLRDVTITSYGDPFPVVPFEITVVAHDEDGNEKGTTAKHEPDFVITDATGGSAPDDSATVKLKAERMARPKDGRSYIVTLACGGGDAAFTVTVPHRRKRA